MIINGQERDYIVHNDKEIKGFFGKYKFLSNFHICPVYFEGECYPSTENAYMAAKTLDLDARKQFLNIDPKEAKTLGRKITLHPDWEEVKYDIMAAVIFDKFYRNLDIRQQLIETGDRVMIEANHWGDLIWGTDPQGNGENNLGMILLNVRTFWQNFRKETNV